MDKALPMTIFDVESTSNALLDLVIKYPAYPSGFTADNSTVKWNSVNTGTSVGIFPMPGAVYEKKYIDGSYIGQIPFKLVYRSSPQSNKTQIDAQTVIDNLSKWLESCEMVFTNPEMHLESINRTSIPIAYAIDNKTTDYAVNMTMRYSVIRR